MITVSPPIDLTPEYQAGLVRRVAERQSESESDLVRAYYRRVWLAARARLRDADAAFDVTQEVMMAVLDALRQNRVRQPEQLTAFVLGITRNLTSSHIRSRVRLREEILPDDLAAQAREQERDRADRTSDARRALENLDPTDRTVLSLTLVEGLKPGEIATRLGLSSDMVRQRKSRAIKKLADRLGPAVTKLPQGAT